MAADPDHTLDELRRAVPAQDDAVARVMRDRVRLALLGDAAEPAQSGRGYRIDRFTILERLGSGGMGAVYAAYDPRLDRRVALKLLHAEGDEARRRLLDEARALARLSHPNVIAVYEASDLGGEVFLAMELLVGRDLRRWIDEEAPPVARVIAVFVEAGRGLAAAHAAGLVHGDVKPENVLVGDDGAVKVADFGLARAEGVAGGGRGGTPAYMAPEQQGGADADARSDQFAFAVALHEAIARQHPFDGGTVAERAAAIRAGRRRPLTGAPAAVSRALDRALAIDPAARFPSMAALLAALVPPPSRTRRIAMIAALVTAVAIAAALIATRRAAATDDDPCRAADARLAAVWNDARRAGVAPRTVAVLDRYGGDWTAMARETCEATRRGEQSAAMLDLRMTCLDRRKDELDALAENLASIAPTQAIEAAYALSPLEPCLDRDQLAGVLAPTADQAAAVTALIHRLDRASAGQKTAAYRDARAELETLVAEARTLAYPPLLAEALVRLAKLQIYSSDASAAETTLREAISEASTGRNDDALADAWTTRIFIAGLQQGRFAEALAYAEAADASVARALRPGFVRGVIRVYRAQVLAEMDRFAEAQVAAEEAVALLAEVRGASHPMIGEAEQTLAGVERHRGDLVAARPHAERAVAIFEAAYGRDHPDTAIALDGVAAITADEGDLEGAVALYREGLGRLRAVVGDGHVNVATARANIGNLLRRLNRYDEAEPELELALATFERVHDAEALHVRLSLARLVRDRGDLAAARPRFEELLRLQRAQLGEHHHRVGDTLNDLGGMAHDQGDLAAAEQLYRQALAIFEQAYGPTHPRVSVALTNLGDTAIARRRFADARDACARALAIDEPTLGAEHPDLAFDLTCLGEAQLGLGDAAAAVRTLERALALPANAETDVDRARAALARARRRPTDKAR